MYQEAFTREVECAAKRRDVALRDRRSRGRRASKILRIRVKNLELSQLLDETVPVHLCEFRSYVLYVHFWEQIVHTMSSDPSDSVPALLEVCTVMYGGVQYSSEIYRRGCVAGSAASSTRAAAFTADWVGKGNSSNDALLKLPPRGSYPMPARKGLRVKKRSRTVGHSGMSFTQG